MESLQKAQCLFVDHQNAIGVHLQDGARAFRGDGAGNDSLDGLGLSD